MRSSTSLQCERCTPDDALPVRDDSNPARIAVAPPPKTFIVIGGDIAAVFCRISGQHALKRFLIDAEDATKVGRHRWHCRLDTTGYWRAYGSPKRNLARFITDAPKGMVVDHIRHDTTDNRKSQLRVCTNQENSINRRGADPRNKTSGLRGIHWHHGRRKWRVQLWRFQTIHDFGLFTDLEEAKAVVARQLTEWGVPC